MRENEIRVLLLKICRETPGGQGAWAKANGFHPSFVSDIIRGRRPLSRRLCEALGLERIYMPKVAPNET